MQFPALIVGIYSSQSLSNVFSFILKKAYAEKSCGTQPDEGTNYRLVESIAEACLAVTDGDRVGSFGLTPLASTGEIKWTPIFFFLSRFHFIIVYVPLMQMGKSRGLLVPHAHDVPVMQLGLEKN